MTERFAESCRQSGEANQYCHVCLSCVTRLHMYDIDSYKEFEKILICIKEMINIK